MSAGPLVKRLRAASRRLPIGAALVARAWARAARARRRRLLDRLGAGAKHEARLIAAGGDVAGFEIRLAPGAITYWRDPAIPACRRPSILLVRTMSRRSSRCFRRQSEIKEADGGQAFGYDGGVIFPLRVHPRDAAKPVTLALHADFAVCEKVCLPAKARSTDLPAAAARLRGAIDAALAAVPRAVPPKDFGELSPTGGESWRLCAAHEPARRATCSSSRRKAGGGRARQGESRPRLLHHRAPRQAEGRRASRCAAPDPDRRRGAGGDDDGGGGVE